MKCGLVVMCHHLMHIPGIFKCEHMFLLFGNKKGVAIDVLFLQFVASFCSEGVASHSDNRKAGAKSLIFITSST